MNEIEARLARAFEAQGWSVLRVGWPDWLLMKGERLCAVEHKSWRDVVRPEQKMMHEALRRVMPVHVVRTGRPDRAGEFSIYGAAALFDAPSLRDPGPRGILWNHQGWEWAEGS